MFRRFPGILVRTLNVRMVPVVVGIALAAVTSSCKRDIQACKPQLDGPAAGQIGETLTFTAAFTDPADHDIAYEFAWGDSSHLEWTPYYPSGQSVDRTHVYSDTGIYDVRLKARDPDEKESKWSDVANVVIGLAPDRPVLSGRSVWGIVESCSVTVRSRDPWGRRLTYGLTWGDGSPVQWSDTAASNVPVTLVHVYDRADTFWAHAVARNERGLVSNPSDSIMLSVLQEVTSLDKPSVTYVGATGGACLALMWSEVLGAWSYEIAADDTTYTTTSLHLNVTTPSRFLEVRAASGSIRSDPATIDCRIAEPASIEIYGISDRDTSHHNGMGFNSDGTITTYSLEYVNQTSLDFYADDVAYPGSMYLVNPGDKGWNPKGNALKDAATTVYDDAKIADAPGSGYATQVAIVSGGVYYLWLDRTNNGWSSDDNFAKAKVLSIAEPLVTLQVGYQRIGGLRWLFN